LGRQTLDAPRPAVLMPGSRRFPPPWTVAEATESFCIRDANGSPFRAVGSLAPLARDDV